MIPLRLASELTYQLEHAKEHERLARSLSMVSALIVLWEGETSLVLVRWKLLSDHGFSATAYLLSSIQDIPEHSALFATAMETCIDFVDRLSLWDEEIPLCEDLIRWATIHNDEARLAFAHHKLGGIYIETGRYAEAMDHLQKTLAAAQNAGNDTLICAAIGSMGIVHYLQSQYEEAQACYEQALQISEQRAHWPDIAASADNIGALFRERSRYPEALECFERELHVSEQIGDQRGIASALGGIGSVYYYQGQFELAITYFDRQQQIGELLGDRRQESYAIGWSGTVLDALGKFDQARLCFEQLREMSTNIQHPVERLIAIGNLGLLSYEEGENEEAFAFLIEAVEGLGSIGYKFGTAEFLIGIGNVLLSNVEHALSVPQRSVLGDAGIDDALRAISSARSYTEQSIALSSELGQWDTVRNAQILLARIDTADGEEKLAAQKLEAMLTESINKEQIADLHYWLWKIGNQNEYKDEALQRYESLWSNTPKFEYRKRIAELNDERVPMSADDLEETA